MFRTRLHPRFLASALVSGVAASLALTAAGGASVAAEDSAAAAESYTEYVALGDSYSAGPLIPQQRPDTIGCLKSTNNYPAFVASYLGLATYTDVTCSGAETTDMREPQETIVPGPAPKPQLDALTPTTDLVTLGIGGNDYGLFGSMISDCEEVAASDPKGAPCRDKYTVDGVDTKKRDARRIEARVARVVREITAAAPEADVFVLGYPRLLPTRGTCPDVPFAKGDYKWGNQVERILNASIRSAATKHGATYINLYPASKGHDACAGDDAWINGSELKPLEAANFHPYLSGMRGVSRSAFRQITGTPAPELELATALAGPELPPLTEEQLNYLAEMFLEYLTP